MHKLWKFNPFILEDMSKFMVGMDVTCDYNDSHLYSWFFLLQWMFLLLVYGIYYKYTTPTCNQRIHLWIITFASLIIYFLFALLLPLTYVINNEYCQELHLGLRDCLGFAFTNFLLGLAKAIIITSIPWIRNFGHNARHTKLFGA